MIAQQVNVDTIANNLANVNTTGYKTETNEFKSLLYQTLQTRTTTANAEHKPIGAQVGLGVRNASITSQFTNGPLLESESNTSFAVQGKGFFSVRGNDGQTYYTRNGEFNFSLANANGTLVLSNSDGLPVLGADGQPLQLPAQINGADVVASRVTVDADGRICYPDDQNNAQPVGTNGQLNGEPVMTIGMTQFQNPKGLAKEGDSLYSVTVASGQPMNEATNQNLEKSVIRQGYLEGSNVQVADEMVNLIVAQRAYELNSKAITTTDSMMDTANNLKR